MGRGMTMAREPGSLVRLSGRKLGPEGVWAGESGWLGQPGHFLPVLLAPFVPNHMLREPKLSIWVCSSLKCVQPPCHPSVFQALHLEVGLNWPSRLPLSWVWFQETRGSSWVSTATTSNLSSSPTHSQIHLSVTLQALPCPSHILPGHRSQAPHGYQP